MVPDVKEFDPEIDGSSFRDPRALDKRHVPIGLEWPAELIAPDIADRGEAGAGETAGGYYPVLIVHAVATRNER